jgi:type II secretory pathway component GspD/PulD (secretin)
MATQDTPPNPPTPPNTPTPSSPQANQSQPPGKPANPNDPNSKPSEKPAEKVVTPAPTTRPKDPPEPPDRKEFDVRPDDQGMVQFQFRNQSWPDLLKWIAETSNMSLDWQELPSDYLNIATPRKQTLDEARDLLNRHLLTRGYTMLELDGMLQVVKTAGINVSLVPKVPPEALSSLPSNRFVRTSFELDSLVAKDVVTEFKPLISSNGLLNALDATNRLEAMDSAANLLEVYRILQDEQSDTAQSGLAREFILEYVRANEAYELLVSFLKVETKTSSSSRRPSPEEMAMQQQQIQMQMQMQQQAGKIPQPAKVEINIVANTRRNSIIANAPPNKMATIAAFIKRLDVPNDTTASLQRLETRMRVYRLVSLDPKQLVNSMIAMDALEPSTRLDVDEKNKSIIAYASLSDQMLIQQTIQRLDGSARDFEVIQLRRLKAEDVAGTIKFLMGKEESKDDRSRRSYMYYDPWSANNKSESPDSFRVGANTQDNQLLLWANDVEIKEVTQLLKKLGEIPSESVKRSKFRVIDANRSAETKEYLERLKEAWSKISPVPLSLPDEKEFEKTEDDLPQKPTLEKDSKQPDQNPKAKANTIPDVTSNSRTSPDSNPTIPSGVLFAFTPQIAPQNAGPSNPNQEESENSSPVAPSRSRSSNPSHQDPNRSIQISFDESGNLVLSGEDLDALDRLEQWMLANAPPQRGYEVFYIQNTRPSWIELNLKDYFKDDEKGGDDSSSPFSWIFGMESGRRDKTDPQLGKKRKLKFISDLDTRSLIVIGADEKQLKTISSLIKLWDVPEKTNRQKLRFTKLVRIEHSRAESIVEAIKDAYRDLLSTNDKAFAKKGEGNKESKHEETTNGVSDSGGMSFSFTGRLSLGIDRVTNSVIVSAEGEDLLKLVMDMIKELDDAAKPTGAVQMVQLGGTNSEVMERALKALVGAKEEKRPQPPAEATPPQPSQANQQSMFQGNSKGQSRR